MAGISVLSASTFNSVGSMYPLAVMATPDVPQGTRAFLKGRGVAIIDIEYMKLPDGAGHATQYGRFNDTWPSLGTWTLIGLLFRSSDFATLLKVFDLHGYEVNSVSTP